MKNIPLFVIDIDLVNYSTTSGIRQADFFVDFQSHIVSILKSLKIRNCIKIPTGDGMIIGIPANDTKTSFINCADFIIKLTDWSHENAYSFRTAVNYGVANIIKDVNNNKNLVGNLINDTARIISAGDADAVIIHDNVYKECLRSETVSVEKYEFSIFDEATVLDKHHFTHRVYSLNINCDSKTYGSNNKIHLNYITQVESPGVPKDENLRNSFFERVKTATEIIFYGIYNPSVCNTLKNLNFSDGRKISINVIYASNSLKETIKDFFCCSTDKLDFSNKAMSIADLKSWFDSLPKGHNISLKLFEYDTMPDFGASLIDYDISGKGFIHISNYLRGVQPKDTPYFELNYHADKMPFLYKFYYDYFKNILGTSVKEIEL